MSLISIIVPVYNAEKTLDRCVVSAISQSYTSIEILLIDDGSTDRSGEMCDEWSVKDSRIKVFHKINGGVSSARNYGLKKSQGDYILMLDSDDELVKSACEVLMRKIEDYDIVIFRAKDDELIASNRLCYCSLAEFRVDFCKLLNSGLLSNSWNKFYKKNLIKGGFPVDMSFGEDLVFSLCYLKRCNRILIVSDGLYIYNTDTEQSLSRSLNINRIDDIEKWQEQVLSFYDTDVSECDTMIYNKYLYDSLNYVRELYCSKDYDYKTKVCKLKEWYSMSYLKNKRLIYRGTLFYNALYFCIRYQLWFIPQVVLFVMRKFKFKNK
jgi:glycosyltransferase involved in cell wall biosynthesis